MSVFKLGAILFFGVLNASARLRGSPIHLVESTIEPAERATSATTAPLVNFQVQQPPPLPKGARQCTVELVNHVFANSYYQCETIQYVPPPTNCGAVGSWAGVSLNWTATSNGTQYDRLSAITLNDVEIWRTSTAEPTTAGIIWTTLKDVSHYIPLFAKAGTVVVDLNNIIDTSIGITAAYNVVLTATFYESSLIYPSAPKSDLIIPLGNSGSDVPAYFGVPPSFSTNVTFPTDAAEAYAEIYASGNGQEEFWYYNVPNEYLSDLPSGITYGDGPFREVRLLVDGQLAGIAFPYPVIFTGGILPTLWRPIAAYGAFDQPTYQVDLTPFLGILADGNPHTITLDVASLETDHSINSNWYLSGNIQVVRDTPSLLSSNKNTTGEIISYSAPAYATSSSSITTGSTSSGSQANITIDASHKLSITSKITTGSGKTTVVVWEQDLSYTNWQAYLEDANVQLLKQTSSGTSRSTHNGKVVVSDQFSYPLYVDYSNLVTPNASGWYTALDHSYTRSLTPSPLLDVISTHISTSQSGSGTWLRSSITNVVTANGTTTETFSYTDGKGNSYTRDVSATNSSVTKDVQGGSLSGSWGAPWTWTGHSGWGIGSEQEGGGTSQRGKGFVGRLVDQRGQNGQVVIW
ncbi:hypothetical protein DL93DRAFT_2050175 [Clavulina sp. PMI_390]|nr:hypothetical protein DL93DRAFT_2050175 [Clavulina sp. PMI_390]